ncbi:hypothetical protein ACFL4J_00250 [Candidatus Margulisiibacteriota bacterium]
MKFTPKIDDLYYEGKYTMALHQLGGPNGVSKTRIQAHIIKGGEHIRRLYFRQLFPEATRVQINRAFDSKSLFFYRGLSGYSSPSLAYLNPENNLLITSEARFKRLAPQQQERFSPVLVLESRSDRAKVWISETGQLIEFKGLTPESFDENRLHINSGQPHGLFETGAAKDEVEGLTIINGIGSGLTDLGSYFHDMIFYSQIFRAAKPRSRYLSWLRMDASPALFEQLADLEGKTVERFLFQSAERFGKQLRKLHKAGKTLHAPFASGADKKEFSFSTVHSGNVEIHGNIIDLEGMTTFEAAETAFWVSIMQNPSLREVLSRKELRDVEQRPFSFFSRASDLQLFWGGRDRQLGGMAVFDQLFRSNGKGESDIFLRVMAGALKGYYQLSNKALKKEVEPELRRVFEFLKNGQADFFRFGLTLDIVRAMEKDYPFPSPN